MIYARKGNQISRIDESQVSVLVEQGFDIVDESGAVLHEAVPTDTALLKKRYVEFKKRIEELEKEIASLRKSATKKTVAKVENKAEEKAEENVEEAVAEEPKEATKPKRGSKK